MELIAPCLGPSSQLLWEWGCPRNEFSHQSAKLNSAVMLEGPKLLEEVVWGTDQGSGSGFSLNLALPLTSHRTLSKLPDSKT